MIVADGLTKRFRDTVALNGLCLDVPFGTVGLVGAGGAGKTTLLRVLAGLETPSAGSVTVSAPGSGCPVVGWMPERRCLPPDQSAAMFVTYMAMVGGVPRREAFNRASEVLWLVGVGEERFRPIGTLSLGMVQKVKMAQALVHDPDLVFLDEPAAGLDPPGRERLLSVIAGLGEVGVGTVFSTHLLEDVEQVCGSVIVLHDGELVRSGPVDYGVEGRVLSVKVLDGASVGEVAARLGEVGLVPEVVNGSVTAQVPDGLWAEVQEVLLGLGDRVGSFRVRSSRLEERYLQDLRDHRGR